ncbi:extracellular solute-binding protein [Paenibacillus hemerocallicola]|uniref:Extracellular solute-binding protein n=1 Tax=Paenibacillus hemerocallicola TaxID=1172614 RepID=A0A5C4T324_9BACL|nr:extracellular solute-binding protein [Paenibacillus hemerocallicola]TNJ63462.1 extracellular solute-binding protein [Paenibacillus hemerocallicola]
MADKKLALISLTAFAVLSGCGGTDGGAGTGGAGSGSAGKEGDGQHTAKPGEPVEIVIHSNGGDNEDMFNGQYGNALRKKFPDYTIKYIPHGQGKSISELLAQKQQIDILYQSIAYYPQLSETSGLQYDMTELVKKHGVNLGTFQQTLIDGIRSSGGGKLHALPVTNTVQVMYYNKGLFDKFGVPYPKDGMFWDDTIELARKLTRKEGDKMYLGFAASAPHLLGNNQLSQPYLDPAAEKATFTGDAWKKMLSAYFLEPAADQGYKERVTALKAVPYRLELTNSQELAMFAFHSQFPFAVPKDMEKIQWDLVALPTFKDKPGIGSQMAPFVFGITSISPNKDAAMEVIKYLASPEQQMNFSKQGIMPVIEDDQVKKAYAQESAFKDKNWNAIFYNKPAPIASKSKYQLSVEGMLTKRIPDIVKGTVDLNTALREAAEEADKAVAEAKRN